MPVPCRRGRGRQAGITLVELLIAMVILGIVTTMLIVGWMNLQRTSAFAVRTNDARATARDAMTRISSELRGSQPTSLPVAQYSPVPSGSPLTMAGPMEVRFNSAFNSSGANADGSGVSALRLTRIWLDVGTAQPAPWKAQDSTLYLQRDITGNGSFTDAGDTSMVLARNVANKNIADTIQGTAYTAVFRYAYRDAGGHTVWTDNADSSLDLSSVVAVSVRLVIDKSMARLPSYVDLSNTVSLRNASSD